LKGKSKTGFSGGKPFVSQNHPASGAWIVAGGGEQDGVAQRRLVLVATAETDGGGGAFQGLPFAPAAGPRRFRADEIIKGFQGDTGREGGIAFGDIAPARAGPSWQRRGGSGGCFGVRIHDANANRNEQLMP